MISQHQSKQVTYQSRKQDMRHYNHGGPIQAVAGSCMSCRIMDIHVGSGLDRCQAVANQSNRLYACGMSSASPAPKPCSTKNGLSHLFRTRYDSKTSVASVCTWSGCASRWHIVRSHCRLQPSLFCLVTSIDGCSKKVKLVLTIYSLTAPHETAAARLFCCWMVYQGPRALIRICQVNKHASKTYVHGEAGSSGASPTHRGGVRQGVQRLSFNRWVGDASWLPAPMGSFAEMGALVGAHASDAPSSGTGYTPAQQLHCWI